jgi:hypothetical protein
MMMQIPQDGFPLEYLYGSIFDNHSKPYRLIPITYTEQNVGYLSQTYKKDQSYLGHYFDEIFGNYLMQYPNYENVGVFVIQVVLR